MTGYIYCPLVTKKYNNDLNQLLPLILSCIFKAVLRPNCSKTIASSKGFPR